MPEKDNQDDADSGDKSLDEKKAEALNLWEKEEKKGDGNEGSGEGGSGRVGAKTEEKRRKDIF